jgi:ketosteroid isomerase-like protein
MIMSYQEEKEIITNVLGRYAKVLNAAEAASIPEFYSEDGLFIPDSMNVVYKRSDLKALGDTFLKESGFKIAYEIRNIIIDESYAFVEALATTSGRGPSKDYSTNKASIDLFILKRTDGGWKIYRYIFNNVKQVS